MRTLAAILLLGSGSLAMLWAQNAGYRPDGDWQAPRQAAARPNPLAATAEIVGGGRKLFLRHCAECHGSDGQGGKRAADLLLPVVQEQSDGALFWKISNGNPRRGMPSWGRLPEPQRWQLVHYVRTLRPEAAGAGTSK
jgi:mono/diheme cytochrome c family protein